MRYALCMLIFLIFVAAFYSLGLRLVSKIYYLKSKDPLSKGYFGLAAAYLQKAEQYNPRDYEIQKGLGEVNFRLARLRTGAEKSLLLTQKSKQYYLKALDLNPFDPETAHGLARGEARLEKLYQNLHPDQEHNPYKPLPYYDQTLRLRPNGIFYHHVLARYLYGRGKTDELLSVVRNLARIYPPIYYYLKKEDLWSPDVKAAVKQGLEKAIAQEISLRDAHSALSSILAEEQEWSGALAHYQKTLQNRASENKPGNYIRLGLLYLKNENYKKAGAAFTHAVDISRDRVKDFERIYRHYKRADRADQFYLFYEQVSQHFALPLQVQILKARSLIDQQQYLLAKQILLNLNRQESNAESFYWLARIAEKEKDFDTMELASQKATVLDPKNSQYHLLFSKALKRLKKLERAEKEAGLALKHSTGPKPWLFDHRAWIRWSRKDYLGAVSDWQRAVRLKPNMAAFYAYIAEGYRKEGQKTLVKEYYQKAVKLDPENQEYQERLLELKREGV
jgi:tetratricopeptide (TPR) repeat protein